MKNSKICAIVMFKNEAGVIRRMLESCLPYIDYYVFQDNGSTDGTNEIVKNFLMDNRLSGELYEVEEGWKGFGWNRDHLIQYCQQSDHGCDWIMKMDCDEVLEIDSDFDWSPLDDKRTQAFHIAAVSGDCIYYRAWMWNASFKWRFNHDPCHETIYCEEPSIGTNFQVCDLPPKIRHVGYNEGQSWSVPTKFISDSLILEEKMIRNNEFFDNLYHFWYIGKSYFDAHHSQAFPLGDVQRKEYARRSIFYFEEYIRHVQQKRNDVAVVDEMCYMAALFAAQSYRFIGQNEAAIAYYHMADQFAPGRNDHWFALAELYRDTEQYHDMHRVTSIMMQPERTNPFPGYSMLMDTSVYIDSPKQKIQQLHAFAEDRVGIHKEKIMMFHINKLPNKRLFVVDNFYSDPDAVRHFALNQVEYQQDLRYYKGYRSVKSFHPPGIVQAFEKVIGQPILSFEEGTVNGCFQLMMSGDQQVYHYDLQQWAAMIYLTPNSPTASGTRLHQGRTVPFRHSTEQGIDEYFAGDFYDSTKWDVVDSVSNYYNRLIIMDAKCVHSAGPYFGNTFETGRLTHLFFFD